MNSPCPFFEPLPRESATKSHDMTLCAAVFALLAARAAALAPAHHSALVPTAAGAEKPEARVRLFALYGIADSSSKVAKGWLPGAPEWCDVRFLDLVGHGARSKEALPAYALQEPDDIPAVLENPTFEEVGAALQAEPSSLAWQPPWVQGYHTRVLRSVQLCLLQIAERQCVRLPPASSMPPQAFPLAAPFLIPRLRGSSRGLARTRLPCSSYHSCPSGTACERCLTSRRSLSKCPHSAVEAGSRPFRAGGRNHPP